MGGYHLTFSDKISPNFEKNAFSVQHGAIRGTKMQYMGVQKEQKYPFYAKTSNDNFCINTFWIGAIP